jgi:hypothetical protein
VECPPLWSRSSSRKHASQLSQRCITNVGHGNMTITLLRPIEPCRVGAPARSPPPPAPARPPPPNPAPAWPPPSPHTQPENQIERLGDTEAGAARYLVVAGAGVCLHRVGVGGGGGDLSRSDFQQRIKSTGTSLSTPSPP